MGFVYRYRDKNDGIIKYVGIVWSTNNIRGLYKRIKEHSYRDCWTNLHQWEIEYIEEGIKTRTDAEYFESHYISLFHTDEWYNKSKVRWGVSNYLPHRTDWKILDVSKINTKISIQSHDKELFVTMYNLVNRSFSQRKVKTYSVNGSNISVYFTRSRNIISVHNDDFYFNKDSACLYYISTNKFIDRADIVKESHRYSIDFDNRELFCRYVYNLIGGGDNRILQAGYGYV